MFDVNTFSMKRVPIKAFDLTTRDIAIINIISINPSQTLLLVSIDEVGVAVYKLPSLQVVSVLDGEWDRSGVHGLSEALFLVNITWLDDENFLLGNRWGISHWRVTTAGGPIPKLIKTKQDQSMYVDSLCYNAKMDQIAVLSRDFLHCWDMGRLEPVMTRQLPQPSDLVAIDEECHLYAVGSSVGSYIASHYQNI